VYKVTRFPLYATLFIALIFHLTLARYIAIGGTEPDLLAILVIFFSIFLGPYRGLETGIVAGLLKDIFALDIFGINALVLGATGFLAGALNSKFFRESKRSNFLLVFLFTLFSMVMHFALNALFTRYTSVGLTEYMFASAIPVSLYTSIISVPVFLKCIDLFGLKLGEDLL